MRAPTAFRFTGRLAPGEYAARVVVGGLVLPVLISGVAWGLGLGGSTRVMTQSLTGAAVAAGAEVDAQMHAADSGWLLALRYAVLGVVVATALVSFLAQSSRRLHDAGRRALWLWLLLVPGVTLPTLFAVLCLLPPDPSDNAYGPGGSEVDRLRGYGEPKP